jgi:hypothetical protein
MSRRTGFPTGHHEVIELKGARPNVEDVGRVTYADLARVGPSDEAAAPEFTALSMGVLHLVQVKLG